MKINILFTVILMWGNMYSQDVITEFEYYIEERFKTNINYLSSNVEIHANCYTELIKYDPTRQSFKSDLYLTIRLFDFLQKGTLNAYEIESKLLIPPEEIEKYFETTDTVTTFDPITFEPTITYEQRLNFESITKFKFRQNWIFDQNQVKVEIIGIIPMKSINDKSKELMFIANNQLITDSIINNYEVSWIKSNEEYVPITKQMKSSKIFKDIIWEYPRQKIAPTYKLDHNIFYNNELASDSYLENIFNNSSIDTITTFDPVTYDKTIEIVHNNPVKYEELKYMRIDQVFFIDEDNGFIGSKLIGLTPLVVTKNRINNESQFHPLYYVSIDNLR